MKTENKEQTKKHNKNIIFILPYIGFCIVALSVCFIIMNNLIETNSINQMNETIGLIAEKVNVSFDMMSRYVEQEANMISLQDDIDFEEEYCKLQKLVDNMNYISIGIMAKDGTLYCREGEKTDITKYGYDKSASGREELYITEPYLSCVTGSNVITMFAPVYRKDSYCGNLFVTYPLESVQELAKTNVLKHNVESYLMSGISGNYITCSTNDEHTAGVWGNVSLIKSEIKCSDGYNINRWLKNMASLSEENVLCYTMDGVEYTQAYVDIECMENWFVVVRIPNIELSNAMHQYLACIGICTGVLILGTLALAAAAYIYEYRQKKKMEEISEFDPLTKLLNRRAFEKKIENIFEGSEKVMSAVYVFVDVDYFKEVNDTYGHAAGDEVLVQVSGLLSEIFSKKGPVARVGGDEFNMLLTGINEKQTEEMIKKFEEEIKKIKLSDGTALPIGCSIGMARYKGKGDLKTLVSHADEALYHIKKNGKDNFCWYADIAKQ